MVKSGIKKSLGNKTAQQDSFSRCDYSQSERKLRVTMVSGCQFDYFGISPAVYAELIHTEQPQSYFEINVRPQYQSNLVPTREKKNATNPMGYVIRSSIAS